jgi:hypothetical protein
MMNVLEGNVACRRHNIDTEEKTGSGGESGEWPETEIIYFKISKHMSSLVLVLSAFSRNSALLFYSSSAAR